ncbi:MAG: helicase, partial [Deltaproteobacteria bacterium]
MTDELFQSIRSAASSHAWSRAVELVRADAVAGERQEENEIVVRVATRGDLISPTVTLFLDDEDWDCDCGTSEDVCEHVAAAAIALRRASSQRQDLFSRGASHGRIGYRFSREAGGLALERVVVTGDEETLLTTTLVAVASGRVEGPRFLATRADLSIEQTLGSKRRGRIPRGILPTLLRQLAECPDVKLDAEPVVTSAAEVGFVALVEDDDGGFRVRVARDDSAAESFDNVAALCGKTLRPLQTTRLTGREIEDFTRNGKHFAADEAVRLVTDILPALAERIPIEVRTKRLPTTVREQPRLEIEVSRNGEALSVLPILVYGDPPIARIDAGRLTPLGDGPLPRRDEAAEEILIRRLQHELALLPGRLLPGRRFEVSGEAAITVAEQLERFSGKLRG